MNTLNNQAEDAVKLAKLFGSKGTWSGIMTAGAMGPNTPELLTSGKLDGRAIADNFWYACDMDVKAGEGDTAFIWKGHLVIGWDKSAKGYKGILVDNLGILLVMEGQMSDTKFVLTSIEGGILNGRRVKARFTWDFSDWKSIQFINEHQIEGQPWKLFEEETIKMAE